MASNVFDMVSGKDWRWRYNTKTKFWDIVCMVERYIGDKQQQVYKVRAYQGDTNWSTYIDLIYDYYENSGFYELDETYYAYYYDDGLSGWPDNSTNSLFGAPYQSVMGSLWSRKNGQWVPVSSLENKETYIITHGLNNHLQDETWMSELADSLEARGKQVIAVSWDSSGDINADGIVSASKQTAMLLRQLCSASSDIVLGDFVTNNLNLIGHSYGAHYSAYLADNLGYSPVSIVGLDSAEEIFQTLDHQILLGPNSAKTVYFYKSSMRLGGGDAGDKPLGEFNFYTVGKNGQITLWYKDLGTDGGYDGWEGDLFDNHSYAHVFYRESIKDSGANGEAGFGIENTKYYNDLSIVANSLSQSNNYNDYYIGVVGANNRIECISKAYYDLKSGAFAPSWTVYDYLERLSVLRSDMQSGFPSFISNNQLISDNIEAVAYLVDYIAPDVVRVNDMSSSGSLPISMNIGDDYNISFSVYNYADNHAFAHDVIENAQEHQQSSCRVWLSTSRDGLDVSKSVLINYKGYLWGLIGDTDNSLQVLPEANADISFDIEITKEHIKQLGNPNNGEYYLYVQVGVNENTGTYVAGELANHDNVTVAIPVEVKNEGTATTFVVDVSGSMSGEINSVKAALKNYINSGYTSGKIMKLITFRGKPGTQSVVLETSDASKMLSAISDLRASGGIDPGEISLHALETAINETSRDGQIILITDEKPYTRENPKSLSELTAKANMKGIKIYTSFTGSFSSLSSSVYSSNGGTAYALSAATVADDDFSMDSISSESATADDTYSTATVVTANHNVTGSVHYSENRYDWYKITLTKNYTYSFNLKSEMCNAFMTLYNSDGVTEVGTIESGEGTTLYPNADVTYYMRVRAYDYQDTPYTLSIKQTGVPSANTMEAYSILATETGGSFQALPKVNSSNSAVYESAIYNFLVSQDAPVVLTCGPNELYRGTTATLTVTGSDTNWRAGQTTVSFSSDAITVTNVEVVSATNLQVTVQVEDDCTLDSYDITVQSGAETAVGKDVVTVGSQPSSRKIVSISSTSFECGKEFIATIHGYNTSWSQESTQLSLGPGVNISGYEVVSATEIHVVGVVEESADLGYRTVQVKTSGSTLSLSHALFVTSATPESPVITMVTPTSVIVGKESEITIVGKNLDFMTSSISVDMGYGVEVREVITVDSTTLKVKVIATLDSSEGFRDVLVTVDGQPVTAINGLDVQPDIVPPEITLNTPVVEKIGPGLIRVTLSWMCSEESTYVLKIDETEYSVDGGTYTLELADGYHSYSVQARDYSGNVGTAGSSFAMDATAPEAVQGVLATTGKTGVSVTWTAMADAATYTLQYATKADFSDAQTVEGITAAAHTLTGLPGTGTLYVRVSAADAAGNESGWSASAQTGLDITAPVVTLKTPEMEKVGEGRIRVTLSWSSSESAVYTLTVDGKDYALGTATSHTLELADGEHSYSVKATDAAGNAGTAGSSFAMDATAPEAVQGVLATTGKTGVSVTWTAMADAATYTLQYATKADFSDAQTVEGITAAAHTLTGLPGTGTLYVRVSAADAAGNESGWSAPAQTGLDITAPVVTLKTPEMEKVGEGRIRVTLSWSSSESAVYTLTVDGKDYALGTATSHTLELADGEHSYSVKATDAAGNVGTAGSSFAMDVTAPEAVQGVIATTGKTGVSVSWAAVADAATYTLQYATKSDFSDAQTVEGITDTAHTLTGLPGTGTLYVRVSAADAAGNESDWSAPAQTGLDITAPDAVQGLVSLAHGTSVRLNWAAANDASGISGYRLQYAVNGDFSKAHTMQMNGLETIFYTLQSNTTYQWRVAAVDGVGNIGAWSAVASFRTGVAEPADDSVSESHEIEMSLPAGGESHSSSPVSGWVGFDDPTDFYSFAAKGAGTYAVHLDSAVQGTQVFLSVGTLDAEGNFAAGQKLVVAPGSASSALGGIVLEKGEQCFIRVDSYDKGLGRYNGEYTLSVEAEVPETDILTDNNTLEKATVLAESSAADAQLTGWVGAGDAVDYYRFQLQDAAELTLVLDELEAAVNVKLLQEQRDGSLTQVMSRSVKASSGLDRTLSLTSGTYFVEIASYDNGAGRYNSTYALELEKEEESETKRFTIANT